MIIAENERTEESQHEASDANQYQQQQLNIFSEALDTFTPASWQSGHSTQRAR